MAGAKGHPTWTSAIFAMLTPVAIAFCGAVIGELAAPQDAHAQQSNISSQTDKELIAKLNELTRRKGYKNLGLSRTTCLGFGLRTTGECEVYQAPYYDNEKNGHAFNTFDEPGTNLVRVIIFKKIKFMSWCYLVGLDGKLQRAIIRDKVNGVEIFSPMQNEQARRGFEQEMAFWRARQTELEGEPDRKD